MNLLCPNCQKMLTVPEEYAGQVMMCPLCRGQFTMPALPQPAAAPAPPAPKPSVQSKPAAPAPHQESFSIPLPPSGVIALAPEDIVAPPASPPPPGHQPPMPKIEFETGPEAVPELAPPPAEPGGYRHAIPIWFSPRVLQWIVPVCLILVFLLTFFRWVGVYPGGVPLITQSAWQAAFNSYSADVDLEKAMGPGGPKGEGPGVSILLIFYVILMCIVLLLALSCMVINIMPKILPPGLDPIIRLRWLILGGVAMLTFLFLVLQLLIGFGLENKYKKDIDEQFKATRENAKTDAEKKAVEVQAGMAKSALFRTVWLRLAFTLQLVALICVLLEIWVSRRGNKPLPKLELVW
jgi:hypothetical protein